MLINFIFRCNIDRRLCDLDTVLERLYEMGANFRMMHSYWDKISYFVAFFPSLLAGLGLSMLYILSRVGVLCINYIYRILM